MPQQPARDDNGGGGDCLRIAPIANVAAAAAAVSCSHRAATAAAATATAAAAAAAVAAIAWLSRSCTAQAGWLLLL